MAAQDVPSDPLGTVVLVTGKEELLSERTVVTARERVLSTHPDAEVADVAGHELSPAALGELTAPSLFSAIRCVAVRGLDQAPDTCYDGLLAYAADPSDEVALVLVHGGGPRGSGLLGKLRKLPAVVEVPSPELKARELPGFVTNEFRRLRASVDPEATQALVEAVGSDLRALAGAAAQLVHDFPDQRITAEIVGRYFGGRAESSSFAIADAAFAARRVDALEGLRWATSTGTSPVLIASAFAGRARDLAAVVSGDRAVKMPPWKRDALQRESRGWSGDALGRVVRAVARADADVKGAAGDPVYALERLVLTVADLREGR